MEPAFTCPGKYRQKKKKKKSLNNIGRRLRGTKNEKVSTRKGKRMSKTYFIWNPSQNCSSICLEGAPGSNRNLEDLSSGLHSISVKNIL